FRIGKHFHWGNESSLMGGIEQYAATHVPLVGSVQGMLTEQFMGGTRPAANVAVSLDHYRDAMSDATGHYVFTDVPEGPHEVGLDIEQLATDYEPGPTPSAHVNVEPRGLVRSDFTVTRLTFMSGTVVGPEDAHLDSVVIRLADTNRYTTPDPDGSFSFYNLREGKYTVVIDQQTLPDGILLASSASVEVLASVANQASPVSFE